MHTGQASRGNSVAIDVQVSRKSLNVLELLGAEHFPSIGTICVVPPEPGTLPIVHPDIEIRYDEHRRLKTLGQIERLDREIEAFFGVRREKRDVLRVAVREIRDRQQV